MLWIKAFHLIFAITWFAGIFYLPRLFVYHAMAEDHTSIERFKVMERKLYRGIMTPSAILTIIFGIWIITYNVPGYMQLGWLHAKFSLIILLLAYHLYCGHLVKVFARDQNKRSDRYYRWVNEVPVVLLIGIVILAVVRPF